MNNLIKILIFFIFFSGCSFNSDSKFWSKSKKIKNNQRSIVNELFKPEEARKLEFNSNFYLKVSRKSINSCRSDDFGLRASINKGVTIIYNNIIEIFSTEPKVIEVEMVC